MGSGVYKRPRGESVWGVGLRPGLDLITQRRRLVELGARGTFKSRQSGVSVYCLPADWKVTYLSMFFWRRIGLEAWIRRDGLPEHAGSSSLGRLSLQPLAKQRWSFFVWWNWDFHVTDLCKATHVLRGEYAGPERVGISSLRLALFPYHPGCRGVKWGVLGVVSAPSARCFLGLTLPGILCDVPWVPAAQTDAILKLELLASCQHRFHSLPSLS